MAAVDRIDDPAYKARALADIAAVLARSDPGRAAKVADGALATADRIDAPVWTHKPLTLVYIAAALAGSDPSRALAAADRIDDPGYKAQALASITTVLARTDPSHAGQLANDALAASDLCDHYGSRAEALATIMPALAALARADANRALAAVDRIDDRDYKARALLDIAAVLADTEPARASQLAEQAASAGRVDPASKAAALAGEDMGDTEARRTGPEGHLRATTKSSAAGSNPNAGASDKSLSEPASIDATPTPDASPDRTSTRSPSL